MDLYHKITTANDRIKPHVRKTILDYSPYLSKIGNANVYCKLENLQFTGSFKIRGALNKLLSMTQIERDKGIVTASTGNHGKGVAYSLAKLNARGIVFVPEFTIPSKIQAIEQYGAEVKCACTDIADTENHARQFAVDQYITYIPPYNDLEIIAGQGTIAVELVQQLTQVDAVFVALGGGGLISGIAGYLKTVNPGTQIIGCSPVNSQVMIQSIKAGEILTIPSRPTISDGTAGGVEKDSITFDFCQKYVDDYVTVTEDEIIESMRQFMENHLMLIEGAAAVPIAAYLKMHKRFVGRHIVIIICGANISLETLKEIL